MILSRSTYVILADSGQRFKLVETIRDFGDSVKRLNEQRGKGEKQGRGILGKI